MRQAREQRRVHRCDCGRDVQVTPTDSPFEFEWRCACGQARLISWAHANPSPVFQPPQPIQKELF